MKLQTLESAMTEIQPAFLAETIQEQPRKTTKYRNAAIACAACAAVFCGGFLLMHKPAPPQMTPPTTADVSGADSTSATTTSVLTSTTIAVIMESADVQSTTIAEEEYEELYSPCTIETGVTVTAQTEPSNHPAVSTEPAVTAEMHEVTDNLPVTTDVSQAAEPQTTTAQQPQLYPTTEPHDETSEVQPGVVHEYFCLGCGSIVVDGVTYYETRFQPSTEPETYLGKVGDFEGTYTNNDAPTDIEITKIAADDEVYTLAGNYDNMLLVIKADGTVIVMITMPEMVYGEVYN